MTDQQSNRLQVFENQDQFGFLDYIWRKFRRNTVSYTIVGAVLYCFELDFKDHDFDNRCFQFKGKLYLGPNDCNPVPVTFLKIGSDLDAKLLAESIFNRTTVSRHDSIISPWFFTFAKQNQNLAVDDRIQMRGGLWVVCYDPFRRLLSDWLDDFASSLVKDSAKTTIKIARTGCLCTFWRENISLLLEAIKIMHEANSFHGALDANQSYAFSGKYDRLKILGISGELAGHDEQSKVNDVLGFRTMLERVLPRLMRSRQPLLWPEMNNFFTCFDKGGGSYNAYMKSLIGHPFLMDPRGRMIYFIQLASLTGNSRQELNYILSHADFLIFADWNLRLRACPFLVELYEYPGLREPYSTSAADLLRFIRNSLHHFMHLKWSGPVTIHDLDSAVRQCFPNFLDMIHVRM